MLMSVAGAHGEGGDGLAAGRVRYCYGRCREQVEYDTVYMVEYDTVCMHPGLITSASIQGP